MRFESGGARKHRCRHTLQYRAVSPQAQEDQHAGRASAAPAVTAPARPEIYAPVTLTADLAWLSAKERTMLGLFIDAAAIMDGLFWRQAYGDQEALLRGLTDPELRQFAEINYGPWDRLAENAPFVPGVGPKPLGAQFYPPDMTKQEFEAANLPESRSEYTVLAGTRRGKLKVVPYHVEYADELGKAAALRRAGGRAGRRCGPEVRTSQRVRKALRTDDFEPSDRAWLDMKTEPHRFRGRPDRDLRRQAVRLQGGVRGLCAGQGHGVEQAAGALFGDAAGAAARPARAGGVQGRDARAPTPTSTPTTCCITPATATRAPRPSRSTCRTTKRSSSKKARAGCSSRMRCARSSTRSWCRSPTS